VKQVLITGVSSGIGMAIAEELIKSGFFVWGSVRTEADKERLESRFPRGFKALLLDVCDPESVMKSAAFLSDKLKEEGLFALINNAGISLQGPLAYLPEKEMQHQFEVNVLGVWRVTKAFWPLLFQNKEQSPAPVILNISSVSARFTSPFLGPYSASKRALEGLTDALRREASIFGLRVVSVQPGPVQSRIWEKASSSPDYTKGTPFSFLSSLLPRAVQYSASSALPAEKVARKVCRILNLERPRARYMIVKGRWALRLLPFLPEKWVDQLVWKRVERITGTKIKDIRKKL
jgi:NAD(P)-dependent dehydrogenase (short-subunit alcohol dehydrogenase family)